MPSAREALTTTWPVDSSGRSGNASQKGSDSPRRQKPRLALDTTSYWQGGPSRPALRPTQLCLRVELRSDFFEAVVADGCAPCHPGVDDRVTDFHRRIERRHREPCLAVLFSECRGHH